MKYQICGVQKKTGEEIKTIIEARSLRAIEKWATRNGIVWTCINPQLPPAPQALPEISANQWTKPYQASTDLANWFIAMLAVGLLLLTSDQHIGVFNAFELGNTFGRIIGSLVVILLFGLIGAKIFGRKPKRARIGFAIGAILVVAVSISEEYRHRQERIENVAASAHMLASDMRSSVASSVTTADHSQPRVDGLSAREAKDAKVLIAEVRDIYADAKKMGDDFQQKMQKIVGDGLLQPSKLDSSDKITVLESKLTRLSRLIEQRQKACDKMSNDLPSRFNSLNIDEGMKASAVDGCRRGLARTAARMKELTTTDRQFVAEMGHLATFMRSRLGHFKAGEKTIYFDDGSDVTQYNAIISGIRRTAAKEQEIIRTMQQMVRQGADSVESIF